MPAETPEIQPRGGNQLPAGGYRGKRQFDLALVLLTAPITLAVGILCALAIRLDSPGPIFFRQPRVGLDGKPFLLWKFRSMMHAKDPHPSFPDDRRVTRAGRLLRRSSLDELPQLINVLRGEMSLVGPRPTLAYQVERYTSVQRQRLSIRPGLTGLAQIRGRNSLTWERRIEYDLEYRTDQSLVSDIEILLATVWVLLRGTGLKGHPADDPLATEPDGQAPS
jgi:lipopolysaccharide/colanic/teichoic acid biosynthesis glycosyltransferase